MGEDGCSVETGAMADGTGEIPRRNRAWAEVEEVAEGLLARYGSFPASAVVEVIVGVGEDGEVLFYCHGEGGRAHFCPAWQIDNLPC